MNDIIRENGKFAAFCAGGAFLLSLLVGLITRNPFGVVLLRAFLLAIVFGVLGSGARMLIVKYVPDLLSGAAASPPQDGEGRGSRVNIVLPEESGLGARARVPASEGAGEGFEEPSGAEGPASPEETQALSELAGELADDVIPEDAGGEPRYAPAEETMDEGEAVGMEHADLGRGSASLDALPDISGLETVTEEPGAAPAAPRTSYRVGGVTADTPADAIKGALSGQDPATLARAIRTVVKNDEKG